MSQTMQINILPFDVLSDVSEEILKSEKKNTQRAYKRIYTDFAYFVDYRNIEEINYLSSNDVGAFLAKYKNKPSARNQASSALRKLLRAVNERQDITIENMTAIERKLKSVKMPKPDKLFVSRNKLIEARENAVWLFDDKALRIRNVLMLDLMMHTMMRKDEIVQCRLSDLRLEEGRIMVRSKGAAEDQYGTRIVDDYIPLSETLIDSIKQYISQWRIKCLNEKSRPRLEYPTTILEKAPLFTSHRCKGISASGVDMVCRAFIKSVFQENTNITPNHGAHCIRRSIAQHKHKHGVNLATIQQMLRHQNIETTMKYISVEKDEVDAAFLS